MENKNYAMMAFSLGEDNAHSGEGNFAKYQGIATVNIVGVNPNKDQLDKFLGFETKNEPVYFGKDDNGREFAYIDFMYTTIPDQNSGIELNRTMRFRLTNEFMKSNDGTKVQVKDRFGRTAWLTEEEFKNHIIPKWDDGSDKISDDYTPAYRGEEALVNFLKVYLGIRPLSYRDRKTGKVVFAKDPKQCEAKLDKISDYFKGNVSEISNIIKSRANNRVKVVIGIKTDENNRTSMVTFSDEVIPVWQNDYNHIMARINDRISAGAYPNVEFSSEPLHEYVIKATEFADNNTSSDPFGKTGSDSGAVWPF